MLKLNEFKERYTNVQDVWIKTFLRANPIRGQVDFDDEDNQNLQVTTYFHQYVAERRTAYGTDDELIVEYIECDSRFLDGVDLTDAA